VYRFCPPAGICMFPSLHLHLCNLAVHPSQLLYQNPTLFMSLPPPSDLPFTLSLLHPHLYNRACHFAQLFLVHEILKLKTLSPLKMFRNSHPICTGPYYRRLEGNFVRKEIWAVSLKCIILSHFQFFSLEYNVADSFSLSYILLVFMWHFTSYMARLIFYFVFCNLAASDCGIQINCKASHIV
jgi:hypothetical protein